MQDAFHVTKLRLRNRQKRFAKEKIVLQEKHMLAVLQTKPSKMLNDVEVYKDKHMRVNMKKSLQNKQKCEEKIREMLNTKSLKQRVVKITILTLYLHSI